MSRLEIVLHIQDGATLVVTCLDELNDFNQPHMSGLFPAASVLCRTKWYVIL